MKKNNWSEKKKERMFELALLLATCGSIEIALICAGIYLRNPNILTAALMFPIPVVTIAICFCLYDNMFW